ncbi:MAG: hypothetical protein UW70_C0053G0002 [Candidatus Peregrinibacteria bacterium GW2011_GWA2_44_7]|nr:MAG: hypothetical protein UW70_C0053G0002 [Candidatus Peregrinibacteria bacterium GW2011_GWA2_44_7]
MKKCLYLVLILILSLTGCAASNEPVGTPEEIDDEVSVVNEVPSEMAAIADCSALADSWTLFESDEVSFSFCTQKAWGVPSIKETTSSPEARVGTVFHVVFPDAPRSPSVLNNPYPLMSYSTIDYKKLGDGDVGASFDWSKLEGNPSESQLALLFPEESTVEKWEVNGITVYKFHGDSIEPLSGERITPVDYYIPKVMINEIPYNFHLIGGLEQEQELDTVVESLRF